MPKLVERLFQVRVDEGRKVLAFFAFFAGIGMFYTVASTVGDTLFLSSLSPSEVPERLPWVYVGVALAHVASTLVFDAVQARTSRAVSIVGTQIVLAATVLLARQLIDADVSFVYFGLLVWLEACSLLSITLFYSLAGDYFTPRDARRLYGLIAGGMACGTVVMGSAIHLTASFIEARDLLYVGAFLLLCNAGIAGVIHSTAARAPTEGPESSEAAVSLRALFDRPFVRALLLVIPLPLILQVTVDYQMKWVASAKSEQELAAFFGSFYSSVGVAQILFQVLWVPRLLKELGILRCLMILPLAVGGGSAVLLAADTVLGPSATLLLTLSAGVNFLRMTLSETLDLPSRELLFLPLPTRLRVRAQPWFSGVLAPLSQAAGGLLMLLAFALGARVQALSLVALCAAGLLLVSLARLRPRYRDTLVATLAEHELDATDLEAVLQSPAGAAVLPRLLRSQDADVVHATLALLEDRPLSDEVAAALEPLALSHDSRIASAALARLGQEQGERYAAVFERAWRHGPLAAREAAILAYCRALGPKAERVIDAHLRSSDEVLRNAALIGIARYGGDRGRAVAKAVLHALATHEEDVERAALATLLGRIASAEHGALLVSLLRDQSALVRAAAIEAAANTRDEALVPALLERMAEAELRALVLRALAAMPPAAVPLLGEVLGAPSSKVSERCAIARVLSRIGGAGATAMLWNEVTSERPLSLRLAAAEGLRSLRARDALADVVRLDTSAVVDDACAAIELLSRAARAVEVSDAFTASVFRDHARMHVELALTLLALDVEDRASLSRVQHNLLFEPKSVAGAALELFDELLPRRRARRVSAAMHAFVEQAAGNTSGALDADVLEGLLRAEPWIRVAAVRHLNAGAAYPTLEAGALSDADRALYPLLEVVSFLKRVELLRDLPAYYLLEQAEIAAWRTLEAGAQLFAEGDRGDALYIICSGVLEVRVADRVVATLAAGECIGELALLDGAPRSATSVARETAVLLEVPADRWKALLVTQPAAARALLRTLDRRIRATQAGSQQEPPRPSMRRSQFMRAQKLGLAELVSTMSFIKQVALFRDLSSAALANLAGIAQEVRIDTGDTLFEEGDAGESLYLVCAGRLEITVAEQRVAVLERNACVGEMAILSGLPRSATAYALEPSRLLRLGSDDFMSLLGAEPEIALALLRTLAQRLRAASRAPRTTEET